MSNYKLVDDKDVPDNVIIPEDSWALQIDKIIIGVNAIRFAEEENEDETIDVDIDYDILNNDELSDNDIPDDFETILGDCVIEILKESITIKENQRNLEEAVKEAKLNK